MTPGLISAILTAMNGALQLFLMTIGVRERHKRENEIEEYKEEQKKIESEVNQGNVDEINRRLKSNFLLLFVLSAVFFTGCQTVKDMQTLNKTPAMPPEPVWMAYSKDPVVRQLTPNTYEVTNELVTKSVQQQEYINKVREWKMKNSIP